MFCAIAVPAHPKLLAKDDDECQLTAKVNSNVDCDASSNICPRHNTLCKMCGVWGVARATKTHTPELEQGEIR